jgi:hypothetical protein
MIAPGLPARFSPATEPHLHHTDGQTIIVGSSSNKSTLNTRLFAAEVVTSGALPSSAMPEQWIAWKELK